MDLFPLRFSDALETVTSWRGTARRFNAAGSTLRYLVDFNATSTLLPISTHLYRQVNGKRYQKVNSVKA
ncbi:MAG: hypothetical protein Pars92KO_09080 [Parasphingorhabdus sp.]